MYDSTSPATERSASHGARFRGFFLATILSSIVFLILAPRALAKVVFNTIDTLATLTDRGRLVIATGPITCTRGERVFLRVTVTQRTTGAVAEGRSRVVCTGNNQQWEVHAATQGKADFDEGPALAVAIGRSADHGKITDAHQWLVEITLVGE